MRGVQQLLGPGRKDESGDFTKGAGLPNAANNFLTTSSSTASPPYVFKSYSSNDLLAPELLDEIEKALKPDFSFEDYRNKLKTFLHGKPIPPASEIGLRELEELQTVIHAGGYSDRVKIDPSVVRGLEYYTGPVFEVELTFEIPDEKGRPIRFGSVGGGGRYDGLVSRFRGEAVPATGFSIGVSRLQAALQQLGKISSKAAAGPVVVTVFGGAIADYQKLVTRLRNAGIRAELYLGNPKHSLGQQMKYADRRGSPCAIIQGSDERSRGEVLIKDLIVGAEIAGATAEREDYLKKQAEAQFAVKEEQLVEEVRKLLAKHGITH